METTHETKPAIYVGTYKKYNEGSIAGKWIDLSEFEDYDSFVATCRELHQDEEDPEFMIQDFQGFPKASYSESGLPTETVFDGIRRYYNELTEEQQGAFESYCEYNLTGKMSGELGFDEMFSDFEEAFQGVYDSPKAYAEQYIEDCYSSELEALPLVISSNIDFEGIADEFRISGDIYYCQKDGSTFVFRSI